MELNRVYFNDAGEIIRKDTIQMVRRFHPMVDGIQAPTFQRVVRTDATYIAANRAVVLIQVGGDFDAIETVSGNYEYATWEFGGTTVRCDMSNLPIVTDTV